MQGLVEFCWGTEGGGGVGTQYARDSLYLEGPGGIPLPPQRKIDEIESGGTF